MKILLIVDPIDEKRPAGLGRSVYQFALALMKERLRDEFIVVTRNPVSEASRFKEVYARVTYETTNGVPLWHARIGQWARTVDCVISFTPLVPVTLLHRHIIVFAHDFAYIEYGSFPQSWILRILHAITFLKARTVCVISQDIAHVVRRYFWLLKRTKVPVVYNGFDHFKPQSVISNRVPATPFFLSVGVLKERKNTLMTVQAFAVFTKKIPGYKLFIVGNHHTDYGAQVQEYIKQNNLADQVVMKDFVSDTELAELYQQATALVFPSLIEGFGFPILEAMAYNTPVITSHTGALAEVAGDAALLVDPCDKTAVAQAMEQVLSPKLRTELVAKGRVRTTAFTWKTAGHTLSTIIDI